MGHGNPFPWQLHNVQNVGVVYKPMGDIMMAKCYSLCNPWVISAVWLVEWASSAFGCSQFTAVANVESWSCHFCLTMCVCLISVFRFCVVFYFSSVFCFPSFQCFCFFPLTCLSPNHSTCTASPFQFVHVYSVCAPSLFCQIVRFSPECLRVSLEPVLQVIPWYGF